MNNRLFNTYHGMSLYCDINNIINKNWLLTARCTYKLKYHKKKQPNNQFRVFSLYHRINKYI